MKISNTELKVIRFGADDVIATSLMMGPLSGSSGLFYIPASQYSGGSFSGEYVEFNGTFGDFDGSAYRIDGINTVSSPPETDRAGLITASGNENGFVDLGVGYPLPASVLIPIAQQAYDAYSYGGGYYSNGQSYYDIYRQ